jgi:anti-sigma factor RsiW
MYKHPHPDLEQLDLLRAGLLDNAPDEKAALELHIAGCPECRAQSENWQRLAGIMESPLMAESLQEGLRYARQKALTEKSGNGRWLVTSYAVAAVLLVAVSAGMLTLLTGEMTSPAITTQTAQTIPDTYEDLDFYLWLANQDEGRPDKGDVDPNNT